MMFTVRWNIPQCKAIYFPLLPQVCQVWWVGGSVLPFCCVTCLFFVVVVQVLIRYSTGGYYHKKLLLWSLTTLPPHSQILYHRKNGFLMACIVSCKKTSGEARWRLIFAPKNQNVELIANWRILFGPSYVKDYFYHLICDVEGKLWF